MDEYVFNKEKLLTIGFKNFPLAWLADVLAVLEFSNFQNVYSINEATVYVRTSNLNISGRQDNLKQKGKAYFYFYLLEQKHTYFTEAQKKKLLFRISRSFLNHKKKLQIFLKISKIYLSNYLVADYFRFLKSICGSVLKKVSIKTNF
jgi:hypothetical protein